MKPGKRTVALFLLLALGSRTAAEQRETERTTRGPFVPRAGYKRTIDMLALRRTSAARGRNGLPAPVTVFRGRRAIPTILLQYSNRATPFAPAAYQSMLHGVAAAGSPPLRTVSQYYSDLSLGRLQVTGTVVGWYRLPKPDTYYEAGKNGDGPTFGEMLATGLEKADQSLDFGTFDNDGPDGIPNSGDDDGIVDTVFFIHPEEGGECGTSNVWSHSWHYSEPAYGHRGPFETKDVRRDRDGNPVLGRNGTPAHVLIEDYTIQPGIACPEPRLQAKRIAPIGVFTHEYGHALGLPDLYDRTPRAQADSEGVGSWCLMAGGSWGFHSQHPETPGRLSAWALWRLGWASLLTLSEPGWVDLEPVSERNRMYGVDVPGAAGHEFFLIELRDPAWKDAAGTRLNWDRDVPSAGLAIWHVDETVGAKSKSWPFAPEDQGQNDAPSLPGRAEHSLVALQQADCRLDLESRANPGDGGDLWVTGQSFGGIPCEGSSRGYDGSPTGLGIQQINLGQRRALFVKPPQPGPPRVAAVPAVSPTWTWPESSQSEPDLWREIGRVDAAFGKAGLSSWDAKVSLVALLASVSLATKDLDALRRATESDIAGVVTPERQSLFRALAASQRQRRVSSGGDTTSLDKQLAALQASNIQPGALILQTDPSGTRVERLTGLSLPLQAATPEEDAQQRVDTSLRSLIGAGVELRAIEPRDMDSAKRFQQVFSVEGRDLPVFSRGTALYYSSDERLSAFASQTADPGQMRVQGRPGTLSSEEAIQVAADQLGLPAERSASLEDLGEGLYLLDGDPRSARVVRHLSLPVGESQPPLSIYIDAASESIVSIE